jgi:F0F1-type ATP synthase assembly protein I
MSTPNPNDEGVGQGTRYLAIALRFAGGTVLFLLLGLGVDRWLHLTPFGTVIGAILGATLSTLSVYRELAADTTKGRPGRRS